MNTGTLRGLFRRCLAVAVIAGVVAFARGESDGGRYEALIRRNPFLPPRAIAATHEATPDVAGRFRFTGFVKLGAALRVGVENVPQNRSWLLAPGEEQDGVRVEEINVREKRVTILAGGETMTVELQESVTPTATVVTATPSGETSPSPTSEPVPTAQAPPRRRVITPDKT